MHTGQPVVDAWDAGGIIACEGMVMEHGATADQDVVVLFITNKAFEIDYR